MQKHAPGLPEFWSLPPTTLLTQLQTSPQGLSGDEQSQPSKPLLAATLLLPYTPLAARLGFAPLPLSFLFLLACIVALYLATTELAKRAFYKATGF